jgi:hypothetical protein
MGKAFLDRNAAATGSCSMLNRAPCRTLRSRAGRYLPRVLGLFGLDARTEAVVAVL